MEHDSKKNRKEYPAIPLVDFTASLCARDISYFLKVLWEDEEYKFLINKQQQSAGSFIDIIILLEEAINEDKVCLFDPNSSIKAVANIFNKCT
jgi:hypothetical protein